jgi:LysR family nitrogen assimilation transcriptional regulator
VDLKKLRYFVKVVDAAGFRSASEMLNVAQPALTRQIQALESEVGTVLLVRSQAGVTPTAEGKIIHREACEILARVEGLGGLLSSSRGDVAGDVHLGLPSAFVDLYLANIVQRVKTIHPKIRLIGRESATDPIESVESGQLDIAVASLPSKRATYSCRVEVLAREQEYLVSRDGASRSASFSIDEMLSHPLILTPRPNARRQYLEDLARKHGKPLNIAAEATTFSAQRDMVLRGLGKAVLPFSVARLLQGFDSLQIFKVRNLFSHRTLILSSTSPPSVAIDAVADVVREVLIKHLSDGKAQP